MSNSSRKCNSTGSCSGIGSVTTHIFICAVTLLITLFPALEQWQGADLGLTGDGDVSVGFSLVDDVHHLVRTGNKALCAALTGSSHVREVQVLRQLVFFKSDSRRYLNKRNPVFVLVDRQVRLGH